MTETAAPQVPEARALLNPAFGAYLLACSVNAATRSAARTPVPWPAAFLVLPLVLPADTRADMPARASRSMGAWLTQYPHHQARFAERAHELTGYTRASLRTALRHHAIEVTGTGLRTPRAPTPLPSDFGEEVTDCAQRAALVGRWLAATDLATAFTLLGVRP
ncbi:three component ABC system middle component [Streptomyces polygonati]|uniref:Three component ABC system middle component n=1 Tax=Streptomyces polygonati TaxID=1617087 RepID=A0ABV8HUU0_9ACTN